MCASSLQPAAWLTPQSCASSSVHQASSALLAWLVGSALLAWLLGSEQPLPSLLGGGGGGREEEGLS